VKSLVKFNVIHRGTRKVRALIQYEPMDVIQIEIKLTVLTVDCVCVCVCVCMCVREREREREMLMLYAHMHSSCHTFLTFFPVK
jgi:hypothetical protein